jgi:predicted DNA-binding protein
MEERMYRAQILLEPEQRRRLEEIARREGRSISAVTRQVINAGLDALESEAELWEKRAQILSELRAIREKQPFEYSGDLVNEARQEREEETERIWRGDT